MKNKTNQIFIVLTSILLLVSSILVTSSNYYYKYVQIAGYGLIIIYSIIRLIQRKPIKIIKNKLDICIIGLIISTIIPVLSNKYVSLLGSIQVILEYTYVLGLYILMREITEGQKGLGKLITNILIISAVVLIIIGIDGITINLSQDFLETMKKGDYENGDSRLIATFGYPNVLGAYIASILFLNINEYLRHNKKAIKALYKTITFIFMVGIILTYSKGVFIILPFAVLLYPIMIKDKRQKIEIIENVVVSFIMALMFISTFDYLFALNFDVLICILFGMMIIVDYIINMIIEVINTYITDINFKKIGIFFVICALVFIIYVIVGLNIYDKYEVFKADIPSDYKVKILNNIERKHKIFIGI